MVSYFLSEDKRFLTEESNFGMWRERCQVVSIQRKVERRSRHPSQTPQLRSLPSLIATGAYIV
ncbi:MAG: hypothetical protein ACYTXT_30660 [Nostoc sp.]